MNTQAVWLHSLSSQLHELLSHWCLTYTGSLIHDGGMNHWGVEACDTEAMRPDYGLINSSESSDPWFRQNRDGWGKEISWGSHFYLYQTHDFNVLQFIRDCPGGSGHPLTCRRTCVTNSWKRGEHYQVKNNEVFRCRVFLLIYTHRRISSSKKAILAPSSYPELFSVLWEMQKSGGRAVCLQRVTVCGHNPIFTQRKHVILGDMLHSALGTPALLTLLLITIQ